MNNACYGAIQLLLLILTIKHSRIVNDKGDRRIKFYVVTNETRHRRPGESFSAKEVAEDIYLPKLIELIVQTPSGLVTYVGDERIDGVPNSHAPVLQNYFATAGAQCGELLPTGNEIDNIDGIECTLVDNGMPSVVIRAADLGISGYEQPSILERNDKLKQILESIRLQAGQLKKSKISPFGQWRITYY